MPSSATKPGGNYRATRADDGTWTIHDVPIMARLPAGARGNDDEIGHEWFERAIAHFEQREAEGHLPRLHVHHHKPSVAPRGVGFLRLTRVGDVRLDGDTVPALFADLVQISDFDFESISRLELPYRSVEASWSSDEVHSLALLPTEQPFFRLPMLSVQEADSFAIEQFNQPSGGVLAVCSHDDRSSVLFELGGLAMSTATKKKAAMKKKAAPKEPEKLEDDSTKELLQQIGQMVDEKLAAFRSELEDRFPSDDDADDNDRAPADLSAEATKQVASLSGEVAALKDQFQKREQSDQRAKLIADAVAALESDGYEVASETRDSMERIAKLSGDGAKDAIEAFSATYRATSLKEPPNTLADFEQSAPTALETDPDEVAKFADESPEKLQAARRLSREYDELAKHGMTATREEYIALSLDAALAS